MNRIGKSVSGLVIAGISILLVGGALITTLAQSGFAPVQNESPTNTFIQVSTQPATSTATFTSEAATSIPDSGAAEETKPAAPLDSQTATSVSASATMSVTCTTPATWKKYTVKSGDTLYSIARLFQTTYQELQAGNCMGSRTRIFPGDLLYVPNNATITPTPKPTKAPTDMPTKIPTNTTASSTKTATFTPTATSTATNTNTPTATSTPTPTNTATPTPTVTP